MRKWFITLIISLLFSIYGFTPPENTFRGTGSVLANDTITVKVAFDNPSITVGQYDNSNIEFLRNQITRQDSLLTNVQDEINYVRDNPTVIQDSTYVGYLSHNTEYSVGQINKFIKQINSISNLRIIVFNIIGTITIILILILIASSLDRNNNKSPTFILIERLIMGGLLLLMGLFITNLLSTLLTNQDIFRFEYLINLIE